MYMSKMFKLKAFIGQCFNFLLVKLSFNVVNQITLMYRDFIFKLNEVAEASYWIIPEHCARDT